MAVKKTQFGAFGAVAAAPDIAKTVEAAEKAAPAPEVAKVKAESVKRVSKKPISLRIDNQTDTMITALAEAWGVNRTRAVEQAILRAYMQLQDK